MTGTRDEPFGLGADAPADGPDGREADLEIAFRHTLRQVATAGSGAATRPGQLRHHLVSLLGPEQAAALRPRVHRAVSAAEEHLPGTLVSLAPISESTFRRLVADLASRRGWTAEAAHQTALDWCDALGLAPDAATRTPPAPTSDESLPDAATGVIHGPPSVWPVVRPRTVALALLTGVPFRAAAHAYAGMPLRLFGVLIGGLVAVAVCATLLLPSDAPGRPHLLVPGLSVLAALGLSSRLRRGLLVAGDEGLTFVGFDRRMTAPAGVPLSAPWDAVRVAATGSGGRLAVGEVLLAGHPVHVGPEGSRLLRTLAGDGR